MAYLTYVLIILTSMVITATCQTFQYSRGWTNGKRDNTGFVSRNSLNNMFFNKNFEKLLKNYKLGADSNMVHCGFQKLRIYEQKMRDDQVYYVPCDTLELLPSNYREGQESNHYLHPPTYENNNDNVDN